MHWIWKWKKIATNELHFFVVLFSESFLPQLLQNACPERCLVACFSYCFLSCSEMVMFGEQFEADFLWVGTKGHDSWSAEIENCCSSYFLLIIQVHLFVKSSFESLCTNLGQLLLLFDSTRGLPDEIRAFLRRAIWFWFSYIRRNGIFILPIHYRVAA